MRYIETFKDYLFDWLVGFGEVCFANQSVGIPKYPFIICSIKSINKRGLDQEILNLKDDEVIRYGIRDFNVSIDIYDNENGNAQEIAQNIADSIDSRSTSLFFRQINFVLNSDVKIVDLTALIKTKFEQRVHIDLIAKYTANIKEKIETIELNKIKIKGEFN